MTQTPEAATEQPAAVSVLEFALGAETFAIDVECVEEIADLGDLTRIPNAPPHVLGVMDLRGRTTSVVDPKRLLDIDAGDRGDRVLVFDPDRVEGEGALGWTVDDVFQVTEADPAAIEPTPGTERAGIRGVVRRDDEFVIWLDPGSVEP